MKNVINWFEIYTSDFQRAKKFYTDVFKIQLTDLPSSPNMDMEYATFPGDMSTPGASGALAKMDMMKPGVGGTMVYFHSEDILTEQNRVEAAGGKVIKAKQAIGEYGFIAIIEDTEGNMIGIHSMK
ncbi:VOC family protein [Ferruginibacter albus]|uniref:VOC family protein n=1 Tax=Ferruginibacter albus TaxID=2875540 RepID=UPI001CC74C5C|nr:VOC family protein [Ferruginibacter albus]UAY52507.1 VOC family protein [Ferruginibacter albus]